MTTATPTALLPADLSGSYTLDPAHTRIGFVARHAMVTKVRGAFNTFDGTAVLDFADPSRSSATVTIDVTSIDTRQAQRDEHLRTNDFFDAPSFPTITFVSTAAQAVDQTTFRLTGDLTIKGVTKPVELDVEVLGEGGDPWGGTRVGVEAAGQISRKEFGIDFNIPLEGDKVMIGDKISIVVNAEAVLQS